MTKGEHIEVRASGHTDWKMGVISFASANGKSLAVNMVDGSLGVDGILINRREKCVTLLLYYMEEGYIDAASGEHVEIRVAQEASA